MESLTTATDVAKAAFGILVRHADRGDTALPRDSSGSILAFDNHIHAIESLMASLVTEANDHLSAIKQTRNTFAPIHVLPDELLVTIWLLCVEDELQVDERLHALALVCKSWHRGILDHPILWCYLQDSCKSEWYNDWVLRKSQNCPLHLRLSSEDPYSSDVLISTAMPECRRWKSFILAPADNSESITEPRLTMLADANLDSLTNFEARPRTTWGRPYPIQLPATPALREIKLERFPLQWKSFNAPQLRALRINEIRFDAPTFTGFLDLLRSTPNLEILLLKGTTFTAVPSDTPPKNNYPIHLPRLRALLLSFPPSVLCDDLLRLIRTDSLRQLLGRTASFNLWEPPRFPILDNIKTLIPPTGAIDLYYHNNVHIATDPHPFFPIEWPYRDSDLTTNGFAFTTTNSAEMRDFLDIAQWISGFGMHTVVKLVLSNPWWRSGDVREIPPALLHHLPTLRTLEIREGVNANELLVQLGRSKRDSSGTLQWPWPQLDNLNLEAADKIEAHVVVELARSRWGDLSEYQSDVTSVKEERPAKLKSLGTPSGKLNTTDKYLMETLALEEALRPTGPASDL
ncbi:hypothetical protein FRC05_009428 [Tulasnella sp. 425]|nr:hypothetical protein FRC05_009428 [Tulasnella sp. 425]